MTVRHRRGRIPFRYKEMRAFDDGCVSATVDRRYDENPEAVARCVLRVHSGHMSDSGEAPRFYWCLRHQRVESEDSKCPVRFLLGPYPTREAATAALDQVQERNEEWDAEDARWRGSAE